jgi:hypothetical protein
MVLAAHLAHFPLVAHASLRVACRLPLDACNLLSKLLLLYLTRGGCLDEVRRKRSFAPGVANVMSRAERGSLQQAGPEGLKGVGGGGGGGGGATVGAIAASKMRSFALISAN